MIAAYPERSSSLPSSRTACSSGSLLVPFSKVSRKPLGRVIAGRFTPDAAEAGAEADGVSDAVSAPLMSSDGASSPPPQAQSSRAAVAVSAAAVVVKARRATDVPPGVGCVQQRTKLPGAGSRPV
ncbi:hypothetical protein [Streptomyces griseoloalbus]|uniref:Uncharacterized protein n=1 Tax=Streptomyces griseoloalbus TaxID=67303 RepID=A0A7W8F5J8_9ACTN|nr:hypothetical protein [Streptomyces albaduncus]MBB5123993.1 hypothetical protein [Streptomyces albaduncus]